MENIEQKERWQCRIAPSLGGGFEGTPASAWETSEYYDPTMPCVFFGMYGIPDFYSLWRHTGRKAILWAGSDIQNFLKGYWLDDKGSMKLNPFDLATWIATYCENYVENDAEKAALASVGITSKTIPSFLGNVEDYEITYFAMERPALYTSVSGNNFELYGWDRIFDYAIKNPGIDFHLYGNTEPFPIQERPKGYAPITNVFVHGQVPQEQMNNETKYMQGALRLTRFDGFSEIVAKSLLWGQWPVSVIEYPGTLRPEEMNLLHTIDDPNQKGREWLLSVVNKYPWNLK